MNRYQQTLIQQLGEGRAKRFEQFDKWLFSYNPAAFNSEYEEAPEEYVSTVAADDLLLEEEEEEAWPI